MLNVIMQSVAFFYCYAECHAECIYAECRYAECHYAECRFAEYCSALNTPFQILSTIMGLEKAIYLIKGFLMMTDGIRTKTFPK
jgi:hypothetical protein